MMDRAMRRDGRNPYGSRGGYVTSSRGRRDRAGEDYARQYATRNDYAEYDTRRGDRAYNEQDMARNRRDYEHAGQSDMARRDYADMRSGRDYGDYGDYAGDMRGDMRDMHYGERQGNFRPVEAMGYFTGYYGGSEDYARGGRRDYGDYDYGYDMRGRDYADYDYAGDYGETLTKEELDHWNKKLMNEVEEKDKQFFSKENIAQKAKQMGIPFEQFKEEELATAALMTYTDYCKALKPYVGANMDVYISMGKAFLTDPDAAVKGGEKLAVYHDCIVEGM